MESDEREAWLFELGDAVTDSGAEGRDPVDPEASEPAIDNATLLAYARGELSTPESKAIESRLITDIASRRRLAALRGAVMPTAPPEIRHHLIERFARTDGSQIAPNKTRPEEDERRRDAGTPPWRLYIPAIAALFLVALGSLLWRREAPQIPTELPAYEIAIRGLVERRGTEDPAAEDLEMRLEATAYAETSIKIDAVALGEAVDDLEVALYGESEGRLERLTGEIGRLERQGAIRFEATASELVGTLPGDYGVYVVIGPTPLPVQLPADLGPELWTKPGERPGGALIEASGFHIHRLLLRLRKPDRPPEEGGPIPDD